MEPAVVVQGSGDERVAHFNNLQLCGSIHACPVCSPRIRQERANDVDAAAARWLKTNGVETVMFLTLTMPHDYGEGLKPLIGTIRASFGALVSGRAWQFDKASFGLAHYIVSHDSTVGAAGWHPHLHVLLFGTRRLDDYEIELLGNRLHSRWERAVTRRGHRAPTRENGIRLERARSRADVSRYVCQVVAGDDDGSTVVAMEMTRSDLKSTHREGQRTPFQLLADISEHRGRRGLWTPEDDERDERDVKLWREWERATKGVRAIRWSQKLRAAVELEDAEKTDDEIVAQEVGGDMVYRFVAGTNDWRAVSQTRGGRARVLRAAERGGVIAVRDVVTRIYRAWSDRRGHWRGIRDSAAGLPPLPGGFENGSG